MSKAKIVLNLPGINKLMKGPEIQAILNGYGTRVMNGANSMASSSKAEYGMDTKVIRWIAVTTVRADNSAAVHENLENNTLLKALGGGGG